MDNTNYLEFNEQWYWLYEINRKEAERAAPVKEKYPDLRAFLDLKSLGRWCSRTINPEVDQCYYAFDEQNQVWMMPHTVKDGLTVYSEPPLVKVGKKVDNGWGIDPEPGWEFHVEEMGPGIKKIITQYLKNQPPIFW